MNLFYYIIIGLILFSILNLAWPLFVGLLIFLVLNRLVTSIRLRKAQYHQQKEQAFYETMEKPKQGLDIIDVEYKETSQHE